MSHRLCAFLCLWRWLHCLSPMAREQASATMPEALFLPSDASRPRKEFNTIPSTATIIVGTTTAGTAAVGIGAAMSGIVIMVGAGLMAGTVGGAAPDPAPWPPRHGRLAFGAAEGLPRRPAFARSARRQRGQCTLQAARWAPQLRPWTWGFFGPGRWRRSRRAWIPAGGAPVSPGFIGGEFPSA